MSDGQHDEARPARARGRDLLIALALAGLCTAVYANVARFDFVGYDDAAYVVHNPWVLRGLDPVALRWALTAMTPANWHPLTLASHMLDVEVFGLAPGPHHLVNLAWHVTATLLLFAVLRSATGAPVRSALVAALFAVHPLHVEAVAWVSQRKTLLCVVLGLLSVASYLRYVRRARARWLGIAALLLALSLAAKAMLVTLPVLLLLLDRWPLGRRQPLAALLREKLVLWLPVAAVAALTLVAQSGMGAVAPLGVQRFAHVQLPNALEGYVWYLAKLVWPSGLAVHYPHPYLPQTGGLPPAGWVPFAAAALLAALSGAVYRLRRFAPLWFGWLWFLVALLPVVGLVQVGTQAVADRYAYWPSIGPFIALVWGGDALRKRLRLRPAAALSVAAAVLFGLAWAAHRQLGYWRDSETLYARALEVSPRDVAMLFNLGNVRLGQGRTGEAERLYRRVLEIAPASSPAQLNLAELLRLHRGTLARAESVALYRSVLRARPHNRRAREGL